MKTLLCFLITAASATAQFGAGTGGVSQYPATVTNGTVTSIATDKCIAGGTITATGTITLATTINAQVGTYQALAADFSSCKTITVASGTFTITLVASGSQPANGTYINVVNYGSGVVTIARSGQNINGGTANLTLAAASASAPIGATVWSDGSNYLSVLSASGTVTSITIAGTTNQINVTGTCTITTIGTCTLSLPSGLVLPGTINGLTITTTTGTLTITGAKVLTVNKSLTLDGTDGVRLTFPTTDAVMARTDAGQTFTGVQTFSTPIATGSGGTGSSGLNGVRVANGASADTVASGTSTNCVLVNGTSSACDPPGLGAIANVTPVTVSANTTSAQVLQQLTLTAGLLNTAGNSGGVYTYNGSGIYTAAALQTPTLTWTLNACTVSGCGSGTVRAIAVIVTPSVVTATNNTWNIRLHIANTATGSSGTLLAHGSAIVELTLASDLGTASSDSNTASIAALDLTGVVYLQLTVATSTGNAGNSITEDHSSLEPASAIGPTGANCTVYTINNNGANWTVNGVVGAAIAAATTQSVTLFALPSNGIVIGVDVHGTTGWSGTGFTALSATVGDSVGGTTFYESTSFDLTTSGNTAFVNSVLFKHATYAGSNVVLALTANQNLNANTITGVTDVRACYVTP